MATPIEAEQLEELKESLTRTVHILSAIVSDIDNGEYTLEKAEQDLENLMWNDGIDYMSVLAEITDPVIV